MESDANVDHLTPAALESLRLPAEFSATAQATALDLDAVLTQEAPPAATVEAALAAHHHVGLAHLLGTQGTIDVPLFRWPPHLYIPANANARDYWITPAPDDHRYGLAWTAPATATANRASRQDGTLFSFSQLHNEHVTLAQSSESGIGVFYTPSMTVGVIDLQPHVNCVGTLRTFLEFFPQLAAGSVEVKAHLLLAAWQQIPGSFDLLAYKAFDMATSGRRDQSHGPEEHHFQRSFDGPSLAASFVVQRGRTYLLGVVSRISITSTLTSNTGGPLPPISNTMLRVWGAMSCVVPQIDVFTKRIDIP